MKNLLDKLIGSVEEKTLEQRIYNSMILLIGFFGAILTIYNLIIGWYKDALSTGVEVIICLIFFYLTLCKNKQYYWSFFLITALEISITYFYEFGINGPIIHFLSAMIFMIMLYNPVKNHKWVLMISAIIMCTVFIVEYTFPFLVNNPYKTENDLHFDLIIGFSFLVLLVSIGISVAKISYEANNKLINKKNLELEEKNKQIENTNKEKNKFFNNVSHEIRTPLSIIGIALNKYIEKKGENKELLIIKRELGRMERDMLNYLTIANIESGTISYEDPEVIELDKFLFDKISIFKPSAIPKDLSIDYETDTNIYVKVSPQGINQIINNLLHNAIKYSKEKGIIKVNLKKNIGEVVLIVQNGGSVISQEKLDNLFNPFYQLSHGKSHEQGMGLGLRIVKDYITKAEGQFQITSNEEQGTTVSIKFSLSEEEATVGKVLMDARGMDLEKIPTKAKDSYKSHELPTLLLVEDDNYLLSYLAESLCESYNVYVAVNGKVALERLRNEPPIPKPDLIISDIMMDEMDGYDFYKSLSADKKFANIPFIYLTAKSSIDDQKFHIEIGAIDYITKPFEIDVLKLKIKSNLDCHKKLKSDPNNEENVIKEHQHEIFSKNVAKYGLSPSETKVVRLISNGLENKQIADKLYKSEHTIANQVANAFRKTGVGNRMELIIKMSTLDDK